MSKISQKILVFVPLSLLVIIFHSCRKNRNFDPINVTNIAISEQIPSRVLVDWFKMDTVGQFLTPDWSKAEQKTIRGHHVVKVPILNVDKSPKRIKSTKTSSEAKSEYFPEHPPEIFFIKDGDSLKHFMMNFVPTNRDVEFGENGIWTGKLYEWNLKCDTLFEIEFSKSKVVKGNYSVIDLQNNTNSKSVKGQTQIYSIWSWLGGVISDIWDAINWIGYHLGLPGTFTFGDTMITQYWDLSFLGDIFGSGGGSGYEYGYSGGYLGFGGYDGFLSGINPNPDHGWFRYTVEPEEPDAYLPPAPLDPMDPCWACVVEENPELPEMIDTTGLSGYPRLKEILTDMPGFLQKYPNIVTALAYYTGYTEAQIKQLMKPNKGPKVAVITNLQDQGRDLYGKYNRVTKTLELNNNYVIGLETSHSEQTIQATALLLAITTLHEFVHYGRASNGLSSKWTDPNTGIDYEVGWTFEINIGIGQGITKFNSPQYLKLYGYFFR